MLDFKDVVWPNPPDFWYYADKHKGHGRVRRTRLRALNHVNAEPNTPLLWTSPERDAYEVECIRVALLAKAKVAA